MYYSERDYYYSKECGLIKIEFLLYLYVLSCKLRQRRLYVVEKLRNRR
jgi:hypothetical protein